MEPFGLVLACLAVRLAALLAAVLSCEGMNSRLVMRAAPLAVCALLVCTAASAPVKHLPSAVRAPVEQRVYPGISVAVGNAAHGVVAAMAYGRADLATGRPLTTETPMRMASVSKSITAAAILMLDQAGKISIDKPVATYVPQYTSNGTKITLRQLLNQSSGIPGHAHNDPILHGDGAISQSEFFKKLNATPLYAAPGAQFDYSNANYYLLADVVQNVSGQSFAHWLKQHIFTPAGMKNTYSDEGQNSPHTAIGYVHRTKQDPFIQCPAPDWSGELGAGGIISTPSDIVRFDIALFNGTLMDAAHRNEMTSPSFSLGHGASYALGWFTLPGGIVQHEGDFSISSSTNVLFPDGTFVAEAANGADLGPDFDRLYFAKQIQNIYSKTPVALGKPNPASLLKMIGPFTTCEQLDAQLFGH